MTTVLAVDGNSLGHRAFHATHRDAPVGPFVTATVVGMLATAWSYGPYDAIVVGFDHPINHRKLEHPEYKAHRPPNHPELDQHLTDLRDHLAACGFHVVEQEGIEADDVLAATADACGAVGWSCDLLSSDRDLTAVVGPNVRLLRPRASMADLLVEDEAAVRARYGVEPWQYVDLAALRGDPSDGLPGAKGIGEKIARDLLHEHADLEGVLAAAGRAGALRPRVRAALSEAAQELRAFRAIATLQPVEIPRPADAPLDGAAAARAARERGMERLAVRLEGL